MRTEARDGSQERRILIAACTSTPFLARIVKLGKDPFRSKYSNIVWEWCRRHFAAYQIHLGQDAMGYFEEYCSKHPNEKEMKSTLERFLISLSTQAEKEENVNVEFLLDLAERTFNEVALERSHEIVRSKLEKGDIEGALQAQQAFKKVDLKSATHINILKDSIAVQAALNEQANTLITYPGAAGEFFGNELAQDSFVAFMAMAKGGKSQMLLDIAWNGMRQGHKVAYFQIGDLSKNQIMRRFSRRAVRKPLHPKTVRWPTSILLAQGESLASVEHENRVFETDMDWKEAEAAFKKAQIKSKTGDIRLSCHPTMSVTINDIAAKVSQWDDEGYSPPIIIIDYMGNIAPVDPRQIPNLQTSHTWALARQLSEKRNCLVVTANQSNAEGFRSYILTRRHFADSKMVLAHVTAFLGINQTNEEQYRHIMRLNFVCRREDNLPETHCLHSAQCLDFNMPLCISCLPEQRR